MAGLKYERYVAKMTMEQKVRLITSTKFFEGNPDECLEFPALKIRREPYDESHEGLRATHFPNDAALAASWNPEVTEEVFCAVGEETRLINSYAYYNCSNDLEDSGVTDEYSLLGKFFASKIRGLKRGNAYVNFEDVASSDPAVTLLRHDVRDEVLQASAPDSYITSDLTDAEDAIKRFRYGNLLYGIAATVEDALDYFYSGCSFVFLTQDITDKLVNRLTNLTSTYRIQHKKFVNDKMTESSFARLVRNFKVFDEGIIDRACDAVIDILFSMKSAQEEGPKEEYKALKKGETARFDEIHHNKVALEAARQSMVLLKNDGAVLPLRSAAQIAVLGEYAKDIKYQREYYYTRSTSEKLPFDVINDYELQTVGFAMGYAKGETGRVDLTDHAKTLCDQADVVILYLAAAKDAQKLPDEQLELLNAIAGRRAKIVAVVASSGNIDLSFADKCSAVLLTYACGQGGAAAALDIITGAVSPSGKLAKAAGLIDENGFTPIYPVGHGLSYSSFEYTNLKVNESGVSLTVRNVGSVGAFAVPYLFVMKKNTRSPAFAERRLRGFTKVFVNAGDAVVVRIPFDDITFRQYDEEKGYFVESGLYTVSIAEFIGDEDKISGNLMLKEFVDKTSYKSRMVESSDGDKFIEFTESQVPKDVAAAKKKLPFALRLTIAVLAGVYVDIVAILLCFTDFVAGTGAALYAVLAIVAVAATVLVAVYCVLISKDRKKQKYLHPGDVLADMIDNVGEFTEIAKVKYETPIDEESAEESAEENSEEGAEASEEDIAASYEAKFDEVDGENVEFAEVISYPELCSNLKDFVLQRDINLDLISARVLLAAIASCKVVFLTSKNTDILPDFVEVLGEYYGHVQIFRAEDGWTAPSDLLWTTSEEDAGKFVLSPFSSAVYAAAKNPDKQCVVVIDNVNVNNLGSYFASFLEFANHPTEKSVIRFNKETSLEIPKNLTYILVPQGGVLDSIPTEILNASMVAEVMLSKPDEHVSADAMVEPKVVSYEAFRDLLREAKEDYFIGEAVWKKIDALAEQLNGKEKFAIGNKNTLQMENFSSVLIECGTDEPDAVNTVFLSKLVYILKNTKTYKADGGDKAVSAIIEKLFADDDLTKIKRALTKAI